VNDDPKRERGAWRVTVDDPIVVSTPPEPACLVEASCKRHAFLGWLLCIGQAEFGDRLQLKRVVRSESRRENDLLPQAWDDLPASQLPLSTTVTEALPAGTSIEFWCERCGWWYALPVSRLLAEVDEARRTGPRRRIRVTQSHRLRRQGR
jgi:hypothetical protein